jgi:hypothetical protein
MTTGSEERFGALRIYMTLQAVESMPQFKGSSTSACMNAVRQGGYDGIQFGDPQSDAVLEECAALGLGRSQFARITMATEADEVARSLVEQGMECGVVHLGTGLEDDEQGAELIEAVLNATARHTVPLYVETHRATLFQDMWRTVQFARRFPDLRFNGDFSHWYTGQEMVYGDMAGKVEFLTPVLERVRNLHGRIGNPGCMQVDIGEGDPSQVAAVGHFKEFWTRAFAGFLRSAKPGEFICFTPELLAPDIFYARVFPDSSGNPREESDRWAQSLVLTKIARGCFEDARKMVADSATNAAAQ